MALQRGEYFAAIACVRKRGENLLTKEFVVPNDVVPKIKSYISDHFARGENITIISDAPSSRGSWITESATKWRLVICGENSHMDEIAAL